MLTEMSGQTEAVTLNDRLSDLGCFGLDDFDLVVATVTLEMMLSVEVPDWMLEERYWTVQQLGSAIAGLAKEKDPVFPIRKIRMLLQVLEKSFLEKLSSLERSTSTN
jgi:hypothetical protein